MNKDKRYGCESKTGRLVELENETKNCGGLVLNLMMKYFFSEYDRITVFLNKIMVIHNFPKYSDIFFSTK